MKILYLTQWYPNRYDAMAGLFVRNHAEAAARQGLDVCVLYCHPVDTNPSGEDLEVIEQTTNDVREIYIYHTGNPFKVLWRGRDEVLFRWGTPDLCQVNVLSKSALVAYNLYLRWHIPYVIVEHWSGYLPANGDYLRNTSRMQRWLYQHIARKAACILPVSNMLMNAMRTCGIPGKRWQLLHNVVYDCFFEEHPRPENRAPYELLHVSCFDEKAKNIRGILDATRLLLNRRQDFRLTVIGTGADYQADKAYADSLGLTGETVVFEGEKTPEEVCAAMQKAHVFILFSRYENAPVVLSECMAVGLPVVASRVGGIPEMVNNTTGVLVPSEDVHSLADAIDNILNELTDYHADTIRSFGAEYSYQYVGKQLKTLYESVLS